MARRKPPPIIDLAFPFAGASDTMAGSSQPPGTARSDELLNMVVRDPVSGEAVGAQRGGLTKHLAPQVSGTVKIETMGEVAFQKDLVTFTQLTEVENGTTEPGKVQQVRHILTPGGGTLASLQVDGQHNVFGVDVLGEALVAYTADLELTATISLPMEGFDAVARTIALDDQGRLYAGAGNSEGPSGGAVWRFVKKGERWALDWTGEVPGDVVKVAWRAGSLVAAVNVREETTSHSALHVWTTITDPPQPTWSRSVPYPVGDVALSRLGHPYYTSPYNAERPEDEEGFHQRSVDWTPRDLTNADERLHFWVAADHLSGYSTGDKVQHWPDYRLDAGVWDTFEPFDTTDRYLLRKPGVQWNEGAEYDANAFGDMPGVRFDGGQMMRSRANLAVHNKEDTEDSLPKNKGPIPGIDDATWVTCMVLRITPSDSPSSIFGGKGPMNIGLLANADASTDPTISAPTGATGSLRLYAPDTTGLVSAGTYTNELNVAIVTITHDGVAAGTSSWRINGTPVDVFTWNEDRLADGSSESASILMGLAHLKAEGAGTDPYGADSGLSGFNGAIFEWVTFFGDTTTNPHDTIADLSSGGEVEKVEGYLAHRAGVQHLLDAGHAYFDTAGPPSGGSGDGTDPITDDQRALRAAPAVVAKYNASGGNLLWAYNEWMGAGVSIASTFDADTDTEAVITMGGRPDRWVGSGSYGLNLAPLVRKVFDDGTEVARGTPASEVLTFTGQPTAGQSVTIDAEVYTFRASVAGLASTEVFIGATATDSLYNLARAINLDGEAGVHYGDDLPGHPNHLGYAEVDGLELTLYTHARGTVVNGLAVSTTVTGASWGAATLTGGDADGTWSFMQRVGVFWWAITWADVDTLASLVTDSNGDVYFTRPFAEEEEAAYGVGGATKIDGEGNADGTTDQLWYWTGGYTTDSVPTADRPYNSIVLGSQPDYGLQTVTGPEFAYVATTGHKADPANWPGSFARYNLHKIRLIAQTRTGESSARGYRRFAVSAGTIKTWEPGDLALTTPSNGSGALDMLPRKVVWTDLYGQVFFSDGINRKLLDARTNRVAEWVAKKGKLQDRIEQMATWRSRIVIVDADDPHNWRMSRLGDAFDWDEEPSELTAEQPISGNNPKALGRLPEPITAIIPLTKERCLFGCQSSIHVTLGDPMAVFLGGYGGRVIDLLTDEQGLAPGVAYTKDPDGNVYMLGSYGALLRMPPGGGFPQDLSSNRIRARLESLDFSAYHIALVWDYVAAGLHVLLLPYGLTGGDRDHWFWEAHTGKWRDGEFGSFMPMRWGFQPSAVAQFSGDTAADRVIVMGGEDGYLRKIDRLADNDDGAPIYSFFTSGPHHTGALGLDMAIDASTLELKRGWAEYELFAGNTSTMPAFPYASGRVDEGLNPTLLKVARGKYVWARLSNADADHSWAYERGSVEAHAMGLTRR